MFHPGSVIAHNIYMLQAGQQFDFPEDLKQNQIRQLSAYHISVFGVKNKASIDKTLMAHLHAVILWDFFDEYFLHSIALSIQFVHNLQDEVIHNMTVLISSTHVLLWRSLLWSRTEWNTFQTFPYDPFPSLHISSNSLRYRDVCAWNRPSFGLWEGKNKHLLLNTPFFPFHNIVVFSWRYFVVLSVRFYKCINVFISLTL